MFAESCRTGTPNELSARNGNVAVAVVYAALRSIEKQGQAVRIADVIAEAQRPRRRKEPPCCLAAIFADLTQPEIAAQFKKNPLVILPAGSVEQHGPHLPTGTDILRGERHRPRGRGAHGRPGAARRRRSASRRCTCRSRAPSRSRPRPIMRVVVETCVSTAKHGAKIPAHPQLARRQHPFARDRGRGAAPRPRHDACSRCRPATSPPSSTGRLRRAHAWRRDRSAGGARLSARPRAPRPHRLFVRPPARPQDGQAAAHAQLPAGADATSGRSRRPAGSAARSTRPWTRAPRMLERHRRRDREGGDRDLLASSTPCRAAPPKSNACGRSSDGARLQEGRRQTSCSAGTHLARDRVRRERRARRYACGWSRCLRRRRAKHRADRTCITASRNASTSCPGRGVTHAGGREYPLEPGDTLLVPAEERHKTVCTGSEPLLLVCFFPVADIRPGTEEFAASAPT